MKKRSSVSNVSFAATTMLLLLSMAGTAWAASFTIEPVVRSLSTGRDAVPGRPAPYVFRGQSDVAAPSINEQGDVVFVAFSASEFNANSGGAFGIYLYQSGQPLQVLMDTTLDGLGNPVFPVPGQPAGTKFLSSLLGAPLINNAGDVVFFARWQDPAAGLVGEGFYATKTTGGPIVKIVDTTDPVPGHPMGQFFNFRFVTFDAATMSISLNDSGEVVYWAQFCLEATCTTSNMKNGVFGTTVTGASPVLLADSTQKVCPTGNPFGLTCDPALDQGFWEIRPEKGINNNGDVVFHGKIRKIGTSLGSAGVFTVPVTGGPIQTVAYRTQTAPPGTPQATFTDSITDVDINDGGTVLFLVGLSGSEGGLYTGDVTGGPLARVVDTLVGNGLVVPGDIPGSEFDTLVFASMNESAQVGFFSFIRNSGTSNNQGVYLADNTGSPIDLVLDAASTAPGLPAPARITNFQGRSGAINDGGHLVFWGTGVDEFGAGLRGLYFYDACEKTVTRLADTTTTLADLGAEFSTTGTQQKKFGLYQRGESRSGQYRSINNGNQVAFLAQFSNFDFGMYLANVDVAGGGSVAITCPADQTLVCGDDTTPTTAGEPDASGCGEIAVSYEDSAQAECGGTQTITRTWTADNGAGTTVSCDQVITTEDVTSPALTVPVDATVECGADTSPASTGNATASDDCDTAADVAFSDVSAAGSCGGEYVITRTWTAADDCGNIADGTQLITATDTLSPVITDLNGGPLLVPIGDPVALTVTYADDCASSLGVTWNWGDGAVEIVDPATSPTSATHTYAQQDIYVVDVEVSDGCGHLATDSIVVVAFDPSDGFTTGGGWIVPDADSYIDGVPVTDTTSKANFGFVVKYKNGASTPTGDLEFVYKSGDIDLHSLDMEWLVITSASKVRFKGLATINGEGTYTFKVTAEDNGDPGTADTFKIEIWTGVVDTENGPPTPKHMAQGVLGGGNIKIHQ